MTIERIKCEICGHILGVADTERLMKPISGGMFESKREGQYPKPFYGDPEWLWIKCPLCRKRPFLNDDRVTTEDGRVIMAIDPNVILEPEPTPEPITEVEEKDNGNAKQKHGKQRVTSAGR